MMVSGKTGKVNNNKLNIVSNKGHGDGEYKYSSGNNIYISLQAIYIQVLGLKVKETVKVYYSTQMVHITKVFGLKTRLLNCLLFRWKVKVSENMQLEN